MPTTAVIFIVFGAIIVACFVCFTWWKIIALQKNEERAAAEAKKQKELGIAATTQKETIRNRPLRVDETRADRMRKIYNSHLSEWQIKQANEYLRLWHAAPVGSSPESRLELVRSRMDARIAFEVNRSVVPRLPDFLINDATALVALRNNEFREIFEAPILREVERLGVAQRGPEITPVQFERWCIETLKWSGWTALGTKASGDQGADVIATKSGVKVVIQCKLYSRPVGNFAVQEVFAAKAYYDAQGAAVVSNQSYTPAAHRLARSCGVKLMHADELLKVNTIVW